MIISRILRVTWASNFKASVRASSPLFHSWRIGFVLLVVCMMWEKSRYYLHFFFFISSSSLLNNLNYLCKLCLLVESRILTKGYLRSLLTSFVSCPRISKYSMIFIACSLSSLALSKKNLLKPGRFIVSRAKWAPYIMKN